MKFETVKCLVPKLGGKEAYSHLSTGFEWLVFDNFIPVSENKNYNLEGTFRSIGEQESRVYFGYVCYDEKFNEIKDYHNYRVDNTITVVTDFNEDSLTINSINEWKDENNPNQMFIGFYYNGDTSKLPDYVLVNCKEKLYHVIDGKLIILNKLPTECLQNIRKNETKIARHFIGSAYTYSVIWGNTIPKDEKHYSGKTSEMAFGTNATNFRKGTKWVKILILANYQQSNNECLLFGKIKLTESDK